MNVPKSLHQALEAFKAGHVKQVEKICRRILKAAPNQPDALHLLGVVALDDGNFQSAAELIEKALVAKPAQAPYLINLAESYRALGQCERAIAICREALVIDPRRAEAHCGLANALLDLDRYTDAVARYDRAIELNPKLPQAHYNKANALSEMGDLDAAIAAYRQAVGADPGFGDAYVNLGNALSLKNELLAAVEAFEQAAVRLPGLAKVHYGLGEINRKLGRLEAARRAYETAISIDPGHADARVQMGTVLKLLGRLDDAAGFLRKALDLDPGNALAQSELAHVHLRQGRIDEALAGYRRSVALEPDFAWGHMGLSSALAAADRIDEACAATARAVRARRIFERAFLGRQSVGRVVILKGAEDSYFTAGSGDTMSLTSGMNNAEEHFDRTRFTLSSFYVDGLDPGMERDALPDCDVIFNAISDADAMPESQRVAERIAQAVDVPVLNRPDVIAQSLRDRNAASLGDIDGLVFPRTLRIEGPAASRADLGKKLSDAGIGLPALVRRVGTHVSESLEKVDDIDRLDTVLSTGPAGWFYVIEYIDTATETGDYIKMRFHVIDGQLYPNQLWVADTWMIRGGSKHRPRMRKFPWMMDASRHFMEAPRDYLGDDAYRAVAAIYERLPLDYFAIDFSRLPDGRILVFEANAAVRIAHSVPNDFAFRKGALDDIKQALQPMLEQKIAESRAVRS